MPTPYVTRQGNWFALHGIQEITSKEFSAMLDTGHEGTYEPRGLFIIREEDDSVAAVDNTGGCAWTENFQTDLIAIPWLLCNCANDGHCPHHTTI